MSLQRSAGWKMLVLAISLMLVLVACSSPGSDGNTGSEGSTGSTGNESSEGSNESNTAPGTGAGETGAESGEPIAFSYLSVSKYITWMKELLWLDEAYERLNANIELVDGGEGESGDYVSCGYV